MIGKEQHRGSLNVESNCYFSQIIEALRGLAETMNQQRNYDSAEKVLEEARELIDEAGDSIERGLKATIASLHSVVLEKLEKHEAAEKEMEEALA